MTCRRLPHLGARSNSVVTRDSTAGRNAPRQSSPSSNTSGWSGWSSGRFAPSSRSTSRHSSTRRCSPTGSTRLRSCPARTSATKPSCSAATSIRRMPPLERPTTPRAYVKAHFADEQTMARRPGYDKLSLYVNSDNGTGRIRGVWLQGNMAAAPFFERWDRAPARSRGHRARAALGFLDGSRPFDEVGLPVFQVMVDRLEDNSITHHSNMDFFDRVQRDDMVQHPTVLAYSRIRQPWRTSACRGKRRRRPNVRPADSRPGHVR